MIVCPNCNKTLEDGSNFCSSCGYDLREPEEQKATETVEVHQLEYAVCDVCGEETPAASGYCESCGAKLTGKEEKVLKNIEKQTFNVKPEETPKADAKEKSAIFSSAPDRSGETSRAAAEKKKNTAASGQKQAKPDNIKSAKRPVHTPANKRSVQKNLNPVNIGVFVFALLAVGFVILFMTGVFDSGTQQAQSNFSQSNAPQEQGSNINLEALQRINTLESTVQKDTTNLGNILELAHLLNDSGFYERSIPYYSMYLRRNPRNADVLVDFGVVYFNLKQYDNAIALMKQGLKISPQHQIGHFNLGIVNFSAGRTDSAKIWWQKAIQIDPNSEVGKKSKELLDSH